jgi:hypothetical protein
MTFDVRVLIFVSRPWLVWCLKCVSFVIAPIRWWDNGVKTKVVAVIKCLAECTLTLDRCITSQPRHQSLKPCCIPCSLARAVVQTGVVPSYLICLSPCMVWCECQCGRSVSTCICTIWLQVYWHWILFLPVRIEQLLTFCQHYSQTHGFLHCAVYYVRSINFIKRYSFTFLQPHFPVWNVIPPQKTDWFKMCYCGSKDKEASDRLIRASKPLHVYKLPVLIRYILWNWTIEKTKKR